MITLSLMPEAVEVEEVTVRSTRTERRIEDQPLRVEVLAQEELRQLRQRILVHYELHPLTSNDMVHYIQHRLSLAGGNGRPRGDRHATTYG